LLSLALQLQWAQWVYNFVAVVDQLGYCKYCYCCYCLNKNLAPINFHDHYYCCIPRCDHALHHRVNWSAAAVVGDSHSTAALVSSASVVAVAVGRDAAAEDVHRSDCGDEHWMIAAVVVEAMVVYVHFYNTMKLMMVVSKKLMEVNLKHKPLETVAAVLHVAASSYCSYWVQLLLLRNLVKLKKRKSMQQVLELEVLFEHHHWSSLFYS